MIELDGSWDWEWQEQQGEWKFGHFPCEDGSRVLVLELIRKDYLSIWGLYVLHLHLRIHNLLVIRAIWYVVHAIKNGVTESHIFDFLRFRNEFNIWFAVQIFAVWCSFMVRLFKKYWALFININSDKLLHIKFEKRICWDCMSEMIVY